MAYNFNCGERIIIELNTNEIYEGDFVEGATNRLNIANCEKYGRKSKLNGIYSFFRNEIKCIRLKNKIKPKEDSTNTNEDAKNETNSNIIIMDEDEYERLRQMTSDYIFIEKADHRYFEAIKILSENESVGVVGLGFEEDRNTVFQLLVMSNWRQVYIFDMTQVKADNFWPELKQILESEYVSKIIHGCGQLVDCLRYNYKIQLENIFDTQVVDIKIMHNECEDWGFRTISEVLTDYFNFPTGLLTQALNPNNTVEILPEFHQEEDIYCGGILEDIANTYANSYHLYCAVTRTSTRKWSERPLPDHRKTFASQLGTYLVTLRDHQHKILFQNMYKIINVVKNIYLRSDKFEFKRKVHNIEHVKEELIQRVPELKMTNDTSEQKDDSKLNSVKRKSGCMIVVEVPKLKINGEKSVQKSDSKTNSSEKIKFNFPTLKIAHK